MLMGVLWLYSLRWKLPPDFAPQAGRGLMAWIQLEIQHPAFDFYADFLKTVVLPNFTLFAWMVFLVELAVGLSLLTGTLTRLGALIGLLLSINLGIGLLDVPGEWPWSYIMMAMWHGTLVVSAAGRLWGIDAWLKQKRLYRWLHLLT
jgi:uncharacterized membrane protein YphA (DoxX/SURF4 family)